MNIGPLASIRIRDQSGIVMSGLCVVHCIALALLPGLALFSWMHQVPGLHLGMGVTAVAWALWCARHLPSRGRYIKILIGGAFIALAILLHDDPWARLGWIVGGVFLVLSHVAALRSCPNH